MSNEKHTPTPISAARLDELHADQELRAGLAMPNKEPRRWYADMASALNELRAQRSSHDALAAENAQEHQDRVQAQVSEENWRSRCDALVAAVTECLDAFVQWDILPADRCRSLRAMLRAALKAAKGEA